MPTVTFTGPFATRRRHDSAEAWLRGQPVEVSQEWLNQWRNRLKPSHFRVEGDVGEMVDFGNDGIPDSGWTNKDIKTWITSNGGEVSGYSTKKKLLGMVDAMLNPPAPEPVIEEVVLEPVEETIAAEVFAEPEASVEETKGIIGDEQ